jgi:hypothetical protein
MRLTPAGSTLLLYILRPNSQSTRLLHEFLDTVADPPTAVSFEYGRR